MQQAELQSLFDRHAYMWSLRQGRIDHSGDPLGYADLPGNKPGERIWLNNYSINDTKNWRCLLKVDNNTIGIDWHLSTKEEAYQHGLRRLANPDTLPTLRYCEWYKGLFGWAVDGYSGVDVVITEFTTGKFLLRCSGDVSYQHHDPAWTSPMDALTL